ncbi:uncharacterized protein METZ01_LOCUS372733, partial [marine metagenome]
LIYYHVLIESVAVQRGTDDYCP